MMMMLTPQSATGLLLAGAAALFSLSLAPSSSSGAAAFQPSSRLRTSVHCQHPHATTRTAVPVPGSALYVTAAVLPSAPLAAARNTIHTQYRRKSSSFVALRATVEDAGSTSSSSGAGRFDWDALGKYMAAIAVQMSLGYGIFTAMDKIVALSSLQTVPLPVNFVLFYFLALKSRVLNPLANNRPQRKTLEAAKPANDNDDKDSKTNTTTNEQTSQRIMPRWTPPGVVFPIVWLLIIGPLRAATASMIYATTGRYACLPLLSLLLHLSIGDVWNTINNVERRYGASVVGVGFVWLSKAHAAYQFSRVDAVAGKLLGATLVWLTIAATLVAATWRLNPDPATGRPEPLYPIKSGKMETKFAWFSDSK